MPQPIESGIISDNIKKLSSKLSTKLKKSFDRLYDLNINIDDVNDYYNEE